MSDAFINGVDFKVGDGGDPTELFTAIGEMISLSGLGKTNPLIDVTSFDSAAKEYIAGLPDGQELTVECNHLPANTEQSTLIAAVDAGTNVNIEIDITDGTTAKNYAFAVTPLSWAINPQSEDKNTISFALKISGAITVT